MAQEGLVTRTTQGAVAVLALNRPPVNALNAEVLAALEAALDAVSSDPEVRAVVLTAEGAHFSPGSDVSELGRVQGAALPRAVSRIEAMVKPVVACLQGNALGGAAELVLACHARVAHEGARFGLPEVALGLLPVAGSTQRLPRLVGAPVALKLLTEGTPIRAVEALAMGLFDAVTDSRPLARAVALAQELAEKPLVKTAERRDGLRDPVAFQSAIAEARKAHEGWRLPAPAALIDCVEAAQLLPYDLGLGFEQSQAETMAETPEAQGLRHAFLAEKRALLPPAALTRVAPPALASVTVLGTGGLVPDVVRMALQTGLKLRLVAADRASLTEALQKIAARQEALVAEGRLSAEAREADWARLSGTVVVDSEAPADLVLLAPDAPRLAEAPGEAMGPVVGLGGRGALVLHPAPMAGGLAQLAIGPGVPVERQALALAFGRKLGWKVLVQGPGAALDQRLRQVLSRAIAALEETGTDRAQIAATLASYGLGGGGTAQTAAAARRGPRRFWPFVWPP